MSDVKFSFINPSPNVELPVYEKKKAIGSWPPLGLLYIATVLRNAGAEVSILDQAVKNLTVKEVVDWVKREDPDFVGFSTLSSSGRTAAIIARLVKEENPDIVVSFGNYHATFSPERILKKYPQVDLIVRGEGELTVLELKEWLEGKRDLDDIEGLSFRKGNEIVSTPDRPYLTNLDALPIPDRSLLDSDYHSAIAGLYVAPKKFTTIVTSRGCIYKCRFCGCQKFARGRWRTRSVDNVMEELHLLYSEGYRQLLFVDDNFTLNPKRVMELCRRMKKEKVRMDWICESRVDNCSYEMLRNLVRAGCRILYFGIESANQWVLDYFDKKITPTQSRTAIKKARKAGIDVIVGSFILGAPRETREEIERTLRFALELDIDVPQFNPLGAFPGTDIWEELKVKGVINEDEWWETGLTIAEVSKECVPLEEIKEMIHKYSMHFLFRSNFVLRELLRTIKSTYRLNLVLNNLNRAEIIAKSLQSLI